MTDRQLELLRAIRRYQRKHGFTPVMVRLAKIVGGGEPKVKREVDELWKAGLVIRNGASLGVVPKDEILFGGLT